MRELNTKQTGRAPVKVELNPWYRVNGDKRRLHFLSYLKHVNEITVVENEAVRPLAIVVNGQVLGVIDPYDGWETSSISQRGRMVPIIRAPAARSFQVPMSSRCRLSARDR